MTFKESFGLFCKANGGVRGLIRQDLTISHARAIIDGDMQIFPALAISLSAIPVNAMACTIDFTELLGSGLIKYGSFCLKIGGQVLGKQGFAMHVASEGLA